VEGPAITALTGEELTALFDAVGHTAFRLECLQTYDVGTEDAALAAFRAGRPRPERSVRTNAWLRRVALTTARGVQWSRVRVVSYPLTEYTRYELVGYIESQAAGEQILLADAEQLGDLDAVGDFWLFDARTPRACAVMMRYTPAGQIEGFELVDDPAEVERLQDIQDTAVRRAVHLNTFLADARSA
jgi:hypothetical protein